MTSLAAAISPPLAPLAYQPSRLPPYSHTAETTSATTYENDRSPFWSTQARDACALAGVGTTPERSASALTPPVPKATVLSHFGYLLGRAHNSAPTQTATTRLKTTHEASGRWTAIANSAAARGVTPFEPESAMRLIDTLDTQLCAWTDQRIRVAYNFYPDALLFDENGTMTSNPDHSATGMHLFLEPLARMSFTSRATREETSLMLDAYCEARPSLNLAETRWDLALLQNTTLMNLLYVGYFTQKLADMYATPECGADEDKKKATCETRLKDLTRAVRNDLFELRQMVHDDEKQFCIEKTAAR